ncbi:MAG: hypothetical protein LH475_14360 [Cryobacterium sp.]|uniref:hypothetical protein n=1 Tax=Cryobacterium sp. TaxID=1926290 RepID=UPI00228B242A|nr:hypothetical protein [Cryobacterium sp.]MCY7405782.1 hypothetical protein [Cryobacterium sp.]
MKPPAAICPVLRGSVAQTSGPLVQVVRVQRRRFQKQARKGRAEFLSRDGLINDAEATLNGRGRLDRDQPRGHSSGDGRLPRQSIAQELKRKANGRATKAFPLVFFPCLPCFPCFPCIACVNHGTSGHILRISRGDAISEASEASEAGKASEASEAGKVKSLSGSNRYGLLGGLGVSEHSPDQ